MPKKETSWIIHGFALLHVAVTAICTLAGIQDSLFLTALTMTLATILCFRENLTVEITVTALILVNIIGFVLGTLGAHLLVDTLAPVWQHSLSTFLVTEVLGWSLYIFAHRVSPGGAAGYEREQSWYKNAGWLVAAIALVFGIRIYINFSFAGSSCSQKRILKLFLLTSQILPSFSTCSH